MFSSRISALMTKSASASTSSSQWLCTSTRRTFVSPATLPSQTHHGAAIVASRYTNNTAVNKSFQLQLNQPLSLQESRRYMSKYLSKSATKRLPLDTKRAKKGYYKGKGCTSEGRLTSKGKFIADPLKKLQLIVPDLEGFKLKPYIAKSISKVPPEQRVGPLV